MSQAEASSRKQKTSQIWNYCTRRQDNKVICNICKNVFNNHLATTNIRRHLQKIHNILLDDANMRFKQRRLQTAIKSVSINSSRSSLPDESGDQSLQFEKVTAKHRSSIVWNCFYESKSSQRVKCTICMRVFRFTGNNLSNLRRHLTTLHPNWMNTVFNANKHPDQQEIFTITKSNESQVDATDGAASATKTDYLNVSPVLPNKRFIFATKSMLSYAEKAKLDRKLLEMLVFGYNSLSMVESEHFVAFLHTLQPLYTIPDIDLIQGSLLPTWYNEVEVAVRANLDNVEYVTATVELWRTEYEYQQTFLIFTVHYIADEGMQEQVLEVREVFDDYTSDAIAEIISNICVNWEIEAKIVTFVTSDEEASLREAITQQERQPCVGALFNSTIEKALETATPFVEITQAINYQIRKNAIHSSFWHMCLITMEHVHDYSQVSEFMIETDWNIFEECVSLLRPFKSFSNEMLREKYPINSTLIPLIRGIVITLNKQSPCTKIAQDLKTVLYEKVIAKFQLLEENKFFAISTVLDPRFKNTAFANKDNAQKAEELIVKEMSEIFSNDTIIKSDGENVVNNEDDLLMVWSESHKNEDDTDTNAAKVLVALRQYLELQHLNRNDNLTEFWNKYRLIWPTLYTLYLKYLSIPAISVPSTLILLKGEKRRRDIRHNVDLEFIEIFEFINSYFIGNKPLKS